MLSDRGLWVLGLASAAAALHHHPVRQLTAVTDYLGGDYACDVEHGICAPLTVIFARDTYEEGNIGTFLGPYLFDELSTALHGHVALQGLNYEADWTGDVQQGGEGSPALVQLVGQAIHNCPSTKIVLVGYGQGATTIHYALNVGGLASSDVALVLYFGDPGYGITASGALSAQAIQQYCNAGDGFCELHAFMNSSAHLSYGQQAPQAAQLVIHSTGLVIQT